MFLEIATTMGALSGATLATNVSTNALAIVFGLVLMCSAYLSGHRAAELPRDLAPDRLATALRIDSSIPPPTVLARTTSGGSRRDSG